MWSCLRTATKPKGTGANCNLNAQEHDKQHIELQKRYAGLAEQAPPYEIASAAEAAETAAEARADATADAAHAREPRPNLRRDWNQVSLNAQERDNQQLKELRHHICHHMGARELFTTI